MLKTYGVVTLSVQFGLKIETFVVIKLLNCVNKGLYYNYNCYNFPPFSYWFSSVDEFCKNPSKFFSFWF